jgi:TonB family protein
MKTSALSLALAALFTAPALCATITLTPLVLGQAYPPVLVNTCASPNIPASIAGYAFYETPSIAAAQGATGSASVKIDLASNGALVGNTLYASSGNPWLDAAALRSARMTHFTPELRNCQHVGGTYLYTVDY